MLPAPPNSRPGLSAGTGAALRVSSQEDLQAPEIILVGMSVLKAVLCAQP